MWNNTNLKHKGRTRTDLEVGNGSLHGLLALLTVGARADPNKDLPWSNAAE